MNKIAKNKVFINKKYTMKEEGIREKMAEGFKTVEPKVKDVTNILMDFYVAGFSTCFELLTGQEFNPNK